MRHFHPIEIKDVTRETPDAVSIGFNIPDALKDSFKYEPGQHLTLKATVNGEELRRTYSIYRSVDDDEPRVAVRRVQDGRFSNFANDVLKAGDVIDVMPPSGHFNVPLGAHGPRLFAAFAAGSGITPVLSIIKTTLEREPDAHVMLFYGNRSSTSTLFRREIADLKNRFMSRFSYFFFMTGEKLEMDFFNGRIDGDKVAQMDHKLMDLSAIDHAFVCGPGAMIDSVCEALTQAGLDRKQVHYERFNTTDQQARPPKRVKTDGVASDTARLAIIIDGEEKLVESASRDVTVLDTATEAGLDVPFSCKGGVCCTCRAKVMSGDVEMVRNQGLEEEEVEAGYVLTCQSFPTSDSVTVSFDA
ncbi:1,2-phenylacetyl-CoA epoxidase subunit PaaE [Yunchengibacter salinarum]|uniref:1,2-phenylacetyl-CoA epoxidase subunit PaaE n=1 Tax=Yunchengibacter salinarum TaxID=3133399 RepID=UPI0035B5EFFC